MNWNKNISMFSTFFVRKGEIGDWKNHMTKEESDLID